MPYYDENQVSTVNSGAAKAHIVRPNFAQGILSSISVGFGRKLQPVETEIAFGTIEGIKREANPFPVKPPLRTTTPNCLNELRVC
jgi:hypothetical protein